MIQIELLLSEYRLLMKLIKSHTKFSIIIYSSQQVKELYNTLYCFEPTDEYKEFQTLKITNIQVGFLAALLSDARKKYDPSTIALCIDPVLNDLNNIVQTTYEKEFKDYERSNNSN